MVLKLENQGGQGYYPRIIDGINNGTIDSVEDARNTVNGFMPNRSGPNRNGPDYLESGMGHAQEGTEVFNSLRNVDQRSPLHQPWQSVLANPLINPTQTSQDAAHPNLGSEYTAVEDLFLQKGNAPALIEALGQGGAYGYSITNSRGQSRPQSTSLYASGDDFVLMDGNGIGKAYVGGAWSDVDRANLTRVNNRDGTVDLNINRDGATQRLLHVDPSAPVLRPAQQPAESTQPARESRERQTQGQDLRGAADSATSEDLSGAQPSPVARLLEAARGGNADAVRIATLDLQQSPAGRAWQQRVEVEAEAVSGRDVQGAQPQSQESARSG